MNDSPHRSLTPASLRSTASLALVLLLSSCGSGLAGILSANDSSSPANGAASMSGLAVVDPATGGAPKTSPARIRFVLADAEGDPASVAFTYAIGGDPRDVTQLATSLDLARLATSATGVEYELPWDFVAEGDPLDGTFVGGVLLRAYVNGVEQPNPPGANGGLGLGNDAPVIHSVEPMPSDPADPDESSGNVEIRVRISDSSADPVDVRFDWRRKSDAADAWRPATASGVFPNGIETARDPGVELSFFWSTNVDLADDEDEVLFRVTADDRTAASAYETTTEFRVDNNEAPSVVLQEGPLLLNPDELRGIPIPFVVRDAESDPVRVVFQWRRPEETFPALPEARDEIEAILADPALRREHRICTEYTSGFEGRAIPVDETTVRLPELASTASPLLTEGLVGRELEILRPRSKLVAISEEWKTNPLVHPVGALPLGDGLTALVLDRPSPGAWRLSEIELATGALVCVVATSTGEPTALAEEVGTPRWPELTDSVLVASHVDGTWRVDRVVLGECPDPGVITPLVTADATTDLGPIRGMASLGRDAALITVGSSLVRLDYSDPLADPRGGQVALFDDLATPWGVACDPLNTNRIYVAEHSAPAPFAPGRLVAIDLSRQTLSPVHAAGLFDKENPLPRPRALGVERPSGRLFVGCDREPLLGDYVIRGFDPGRAGDRVIPEVDGLSSPVASLSTGRDRLRILTQSNVDRVSVAGGVEQRRAIASSAGRPYSVAVESPFRPGLAADRSWRLAPLLAPLLAQGNPDGTRSVFTWDSRDAGQGRVFFKATPVDDEREEPNESAAGKSVRSGLETAAALGGSPLSDGPFPVAAADLDRDGDLDLVSANVDSNNLTVFLQESPGVFASTPLVLGGPALTDKPIFVAAADLDRDGDLDLVSTNQFSHNLTVFWGGR